MKPFNIGERLKALRKSKGLTTSEVAEKVNVSQSYISRFENNKAVPDIEMLANILNVLGTDIPSFFSNDLSDDLQRLLNAAKDLTPEQRAKLTEFIQTLKG